MEEDYFKKVFSNNLKFYMNLNNKSQVDIINDLGINKSAISTWCNGTRLPRMDKVDMLAKYFGINRSDLIEEKKHSTTPVNNYYLSDSEKEHIEKYKTIDDDGKKIVDTILNREYKQFKERQNIISLNAAHEIPNSSKADQQHDDDIMDDDNF